MLKREFTRSEFDELLFDTEMLETKLKGIAVRTEITKEKAIVEYLHVKNLRFYIDVWNCVPRFAMRTHLGKGQMKTKIIELKNEKAINLFEKLVEIRDVIINLSGHYYIETLQQKKLLDEIVVTEGFFRCKNFDNCDAFIEGDCPLTEKCTEYIKG